MEEQRMNRVWLGLFRNVEIKISGLFLFCSCMMYN